MIFKTKESGVRWGQPGSLSRFVAGTVFIQDSYLEVDAPLKEMPWQSKLKARHLHYKKKRQLSELTLQN